MKGAALRPVSSASAKSLPAPTLARTGGPVMKSCSFTNG